MLIAPLFVAASVLGADQDVFVTDWWESRIGVHFVEPVTIGGVMLPEAYPFGFIQGAIELPHDGLSRVTIPVISGQSPTNALEFVEVRIDGEEVAQIDAGDDVVVTTVIRGPAFDYGFEFSGALEGVGTDLIVKNGIVEPLCAGDINGDSSVDVLDLVEFRRAFQAGERVADCNGDDEFNVLDYLCFRQAYANSCK